MKSLVVLCVAATVACSAGHLVSHPGLYGYPGIVGPYHGFLGHNYLHPTPYVAPGYAALKTVPVAAAHYSAVPVAPVAPVTPIQSQYHAQDELGQYSFGYVGGPSSRAETRDAYGVVRGSYNYVDSEGKLQTQHYVADALGFRVSGTNLPVAPEAPEVPALTGPEPVMDTPEVAAAKAAFQTAYDEAAAAAEEAHDSRKKRSVPASPLYSLASPLRFSYGFSAPLTYSHTAVPYIYSSAFPTITSYAAAPTKVRDATLLRVVHNPGHAVSYRVD